MVAEPCRGGDFGMQQFLLFATINNTTRLTKQVKRPSNHQFSCISVKMKLETKLALEPNRVI